MLTGLSLMDTVENGDFLSALKLLSPIRSCAGHRLV